MLNLLSCNHLHQGFYNKIIIKNQNRVMLFIKLMNLVLFFKRVILKEIKLNQTLMEVSLKEWMNFHCKKSKTNPAFL